MKRKRGIPSFTLVEMLVGIAVFSLFMLLLSAILGGAIQLWSGQASREDSYREVRAAFNAISRDMSSALVTTNSGWFYSNGTNQLAFLTSVPDTAQGSTVNQGDICAVCYSLEWSTNDASGYQTNMSLYRYISFSSSTYNNVINGSQAVNSIVTGVDGVNTVRQLIARDVAQISFMSYTNDATGTPQQCLDATTPVTVMPNLVNVSMTALNSRVAVRLTSQAQWQNISSAQYQKNMETFNLRVRPPSP